MADRSILLVAVETPYAETIGAWCTQHDIVASYCELDEAVSSASHRLSLCILQLGHDAAAGVDRIPGLTKLLRRCPLVVLARDLGADDAFRLSRAGVADLVELPQESGEVLARCMGHLADSGEPGDAGRSLVGESRAIRELRRQIAQAATHDSKVLLQGETGTGKGLVARQIHERSRRAAGPFVHVDCAALSPTLIESELFGHERGAFTGADSLRRGRFETAANGTIFLDEIGDLDAPLQSKLLRVLEDHVYERVGGSRSLPMSARVIAATSHDLFEAVREGRFRRDLYYRLSVLSYEIPPLRERMDDLPLLVRAGLDRLGAQLAVPIPAVGDDFLEALTDHSWPGNVRELMNLLERLLVQTRASTLQAPDLDGLLQFEPPAPSVRDAGTDEDDEAAMIRAALIDTGGNVTRAARRLGMARGTLRYKIQRHELGDLIPSD